MFMYWLMEQEDRDDEIGVLYRTIFKDYNNGCLSAVTDLKKIAEHFISHHPATFFDMKDQIALALKAYAEGSER